MTNLPQIIVLVLLLVSAGCGLQKAASGEMEDGFIAIAANGVMLGLLYWGGFWGG